MNTSGAVAPAPTLKHARTAGLVAPAPLSPGHLHRALSLLSLSSVCLLIGLQYGRYSILANEGAYLVGALRVVDPEVLANDWSVGGAPLLGATARLFEFLIAPAWIIFDDPILVALAGRLVLWVAVLAGLGAVGRAAGISGAGLWAGVLLYLLGPTGLAAMEWLFTGAEQKVAAYATVLFSLACAIRGRAVRAGIFAGLGVNFHLLVGGWGGLALGIAMLADGRRLGLKRIAQFAASAAALALPPLVVGLRYLTAGDSSASSPELEREVDRIVISVVNPFHLDPSHFLSHGHSIRIPLVVVGASLAARLLPVGSAARIVSAFLLTLATFFVAGLVAHVLSLSSLIKLYPFRVGDVLLPLFFWIGVPHLVYRVLWLEPRAHTATLRVLVLALGMGASAMLARDAGGTTRRIEATLASYGPEARLRLEAKRAFWNEIRERTPDDAVFVTSPCAKSFWLETRRGMVASFKAVPSNRKVLEWIERIEALNGGRPLTQRGFQICDEVERSLPALLPSDLAVLHARFGATHYVVGRERAELAPALVFVSERGEHVYDLERLPSPEAQTSMQGP